MNTAALVAFIKKQPIGFACGIICLACGLLLYFRSDVIAENQKLYEERSKQADMMETNVRNAKDLSAQVAAMQAASKEMESRLVRASQLALNYRYFYRIIDETGIKLNGDVRQNALPASGAKAGYQSVPYNLSVQGSFPKLLAFLQRMESGGHFCRFNNINISKSQGRGEQGSDTLTVTVALDLMGVP